MALFGRKRLPARSTLSRFVAALPPEPVEALRSLFLSDVLAYPLVSEEQPAGLWDRTEKQWQVFDIDGTREAARQRALPQNAELPAPQRRLRPLCAAFLHGAEARGSRPLPDHDLAGSYPKVGSAPLVGQVMASRERNYAGRWLRSSATSRPIRSQQRMRGSRLDGQYGTGATLSDLAGLPFVMRGKDSQLLSRTEIQFRLSLPPDQQFSRPESARGRTLYDCPEVSVGANGERCRIVGATHRAGPTKPRVGVERNGIVSELFLTMLPQGAFTAADVVALSLHRGSFEIALSDEDTEQDPDRWCSHTAWGQECWQIVAQWVWNLRLELGHRLHPDPVRTTEFAPAQPAGQAPVADSASPVQGYGPAEVALGWKAGRFSGRDFAFQPDGTLCCPANQKLSAHERRRARRWEPACGVRCQHWQLPSLSSARPVPMAGQGDSEAASGEWALASPQDRVGSSPVAGLEPETLSSSLPAPPARSMPGGADGAASLCWFR